MNAIDRLVLYQQSKKKEIGGQNKFESYVGLSSGYLSNMQKKRGAITSDVMIKVLDKFPLLNLDWLLTGQGEMEKGNGVSNAITAGQDIVSGLNNASGGSIVGNKVHSGNINGNGNSVGILPADCEKELMKSQCEVEYLKKEIKSLKDQMKQISADKEKALIDKDKAMNMLEKALSR